MITTFLSIILAYLTFNYFTESSRWLHSMGKKEECLEVLSFIAKKNNKEKEWIDYQKNNPDIINQIGKLKNENNNKEKIKKNYNIIRSNLWQFKF